MPDSVCLKPVTAETCRAVAELHRAAFPVESVELSIYASDRVHFYLAALVAHRSVKPDHHILGAWLDERLVGYAHFRHVEGRWHLNNIAVLPSQRGIGVGRLLLDRWAEMAVERGYSELSLDVQGTSKSARDWYLRLGFVEVATTFLHKVPSSTVDAGGKDSRTGRVRLVGWENAEAWQGHYGFSSFDVNIAERAWHIDRLPRRYFRIEDGFPAEGMLLLQELDSSRDVLIAIVGSCPRAEHDCVMVSHRMVTPVRWPL